MPVEALPGHIIRFYGNRCRHLTLANCDDGRVRVTFDFRVLPRHLACPEIAKLSLVELAKQHRYKLHVWQPTCDVNPVTLPNDPSMHGLAIVEPTGQ